MLHNQPIHHSLDCVPLVLVERDFLVEFAHFAVDTHAHKALAAGVLQYSLVLAGLVAYQWCQQQQAAPIWQPQNGIHNLGGALAGERAATVWAVRATNAGEQQAQKIIDFRHRANRRARVAAAALLVNRNRGRKAIDTVHIGLVELAQKLARIRRQRFDIATLAFGKNCVEGQG